MSVHSMHWSRRCRCKNGKPSLAEKAERAPRPSGEITLHGLANALGVLLPENVIVVDEAMTSGRGLMAATTGAPPHDWLGNTGGSIGIALPFAVGAASRLSHSARVYVSLRMAAGCTRLKRCGPWRAKVSTSRPWCSPTALMRCLSGNFPALALVPWSSRRGFIRHRPSHSRLGASGEGYGRACEPRHFARFVCKIIERRI